MERRIHAAPVGLPQRGDWRGDHAYRRVQVRGVFLHRAETLVQAVTDRGPGWWVMTPLRTMHGTILVNRGFLPPDRIGPSSGRPDRIAGPVEVTGLLRAGEPGGGFLRSNDPAAGRWFSRDVAAIARARGLADVAPFFLDADGTPDPGGYPIGGLTVVAFRNNHLAYALTWFVLAALAAGGAWMMLVRRDDG